MIEMKSAYYDSVGVVGPVGIDLGALPFAADRGAAGFVVADLLGVDLVVAGFVAADLVAAGRVVAGLVAAGLVSADLVAAGLVAAGLVTDGLVTVVGLIVAALRTIRV